MREQKLASRETAHYLINDLIREGKLNKTEINTQLHFLTINKKNEFNKIYNSLSEIEKSIDISYSLKKGVIPDLLLTSLLPNYIVSIKTILDFLVVMTAYKIRSEKDLLILDKKSAELTERINSHPSYNRNWLNDINSNIKNLKKMEAAFIRKYPNINKWFDNLISCLEDFKKDYLSETQQHIKDPHEKSG